jgi:hypothetical protein
LDEINIHLAYKKGDLEALKASLGYPPDFPNQITEPAVDYIINGILYKSFHKSTIVLLGR